MPITYVTGDMFELIKPSSNIVIPHVCNDIGRWGAGFVMALSKRWPVDAKEESPEYMYRRWADLPSVKPPFELGQVQFVVVPQGITVANMVAQSGTVNAKNPRPIKYDALAKCLRTVAVACGDACEIHAPMFGAGLAGGNWKVISALIEEIWCEPGIQVTVYKLG